MLYGILIFLFSVVSLFLIILILVQKGKSSMGIGNLGGSTQLLFGGSGGQDLFQKLTWALGGIFMLGSLLLAHLKEESSVLLKTISKQEIVNKVVSDETSQLTNEQKEKQEKKEEDVQKEDSNNKNIGTTNSEKEKKQVDEVKAKKESKNNNKKNLEK